MRASSPVKGAASGALEPRLGPWERKRKGSRGGTEVIISHSIIRSVNVVQCLLCAPDRGGPGIPCQVWTLTGPTFEWGGWDRQMCKWSNCKHDIKDINRGLGEAMSGAWLHCSAR